MSDSGVSASAGSSNPFRRKSTAAAGVSASATNATTADPSFHSASEALDLPPQHPNASDFFRQQLQALPPTSEPPPSTTFQKPKIVKKVRVQSPPPSSPESASAPHEYPAYGYPEDDSESSSSSSSEDEKPEAAASRGMAAPLGVIANANSSSPDNAHAVSSRAPPNPFTKTLEDMENGTSHISELSSPSTGGKGSLDVDAFKRLLMTGEAPISGPVPSSALPGTSTHNTHPQAADAASITDASSVSRQSIFDTAAAQETPRTSHEISEAEGEEDRRGLVQQSQTKTQQTASTLRKKPPPPSSRHGKLIKIDLSKTESDMSLGHESAQRPAASSNQTPGSPGSTSSRRRPSTPSDVNKPLPPAPVRRSFEEGSESIFDREAAGKVPETVDSELEADVIATPRPPTPPNASHANTADRAPPDPRKPPPPPRRKSHSRTESKVSKAAVPSVPTAFAEELSLPRRSSQDSTRSRSSSLQANIHAPAPAPPPPRRPNHASRPSFTSPSGSGFMGATPPPGASTAASPGASSDREHPPFHSPVPLTASPAPASPAPSTLDTSSVTPAASVLSPSTGKTKMSPPPLPPARNASVRTASGARPASLRGVEATSRRVNTTGSAPPPPPPPPKRSRAGSGRDRGALLGGPVTEEPEPGLGTPDDGSSAVRTSEDKSAGDILADLDALQREVDALRGQYEKRPASGV